MTQQSGFRRGHFTETALLNVIDVITSTLTTNNCYQLVMLDNSSDFDTLDHHIILSRLHLLGVITIDTLPSQCLLHIYLTVLAV